VQRGRAGLGSTQKEEIGTNYTVALLHHDDPSLLINAT
jgi:hypothetical protein